MGTTKIDNFSENNFFLVGIGASAGGLDSIQKLFDNLPDDTGMAFVIIQHLSPDFKSLMPELLAKHTKMPILTAEDKQVIKPNCIYLNQSNKNLEVKGRKLNLLNKEAKGKLNLPIDMFFHTLGEEFKDMSIGVILSGTGSDGSRGIKTIKEAGGTILVQDPATAQFDGMPNSSILTNLVDFILTPPELAKALVKLIKQPLLIKSGHRNEESNEVIFQNILKEILKETGIDFRNYKRNTLIRRLEKRLSITNHDDLNDYFKYMKVTATEKDILKKDFLIGVTSFFRDKEPFHYLKEKIIPEICSNKSESETIRIWIPACSTGEEVYSIAMYIDEYITTKKVRTDFKIFATDIDSSALNIASAGIYHINIVNELEESYFDQYFVKSGDKIQVIKRLREKIVFSTHNVLKDPPFIRMDLISCRNLLIYFEKNMQDKVLMNFQFALNQFGYLFLGTSESLGESSKYYRIIDNKNKIFQNISDFKRIQQHTADNDYQVWSKPESSAMPQSVSPNRIHKNPELMFSRYLNKQFSPSALFIDSNFNILFIQGDAGKWLKYSEGIVQNNLLSSISVDLAPIIRSGIRRVASSKKEVIIKNVSWETDKGIIQTDLTFHKPEKDTEFSNFFLIQFSKEEIFSEQEKIVIENVSLDDLSKQRMEDLENDLKLTKNELQNTVEELETSNEELQSSNEELMASNEELQSTNEELQSVNEELYTVNTELQEKNREMQCVNDDVSNLLNSTDIGTLFLDAKLNIRKFTPLLTKHFYLNESDIGRSIESFASTFNDQTRNSIIRDSKNALQTLSAIEKEIVDSEGKYYLQRISPFITVDKKIDGVVITFTNIDMLKEAQHKLQVSESKFRTYFENSPNGKIVVDLKGKIVEVNTTFAKMLGYREEEIRNLYFTDFTFDDDIEKFKKVIHSLVKGKLEKEQIEKRYVRKDGSTIWADVRSTIQKNYDGEPEYLLIDVIDISKEKELKEQILAAKEDLENANAKLKKAIKEAEKANIYKNQFLANMSHEIRTPMNGVIGFANLLKEDHLSKNQKISYLEIIENNSNQLLRLIDDIINIAKIEAGELAIEPTPFNLCQMLEELESTFNQIKKQKNKEQIEIRTSFQKSDKKIFLVSDPTRLRQVFNNLLGNALKFTLKGYIEFGFKVKKEKIVFYVKDTGVGIDSEKIQKIYDRFYRIENKQLSVTEGTGLGLAITKGIIQLLGGDIQVDSKVNKGTTFSFDIPLVVAEKEVTQLQESNQNLKSNGKLDGKTILIAEDDETIRIFFKALLKDMKLNLVFANNGLEAVDLYKNLNNTDLVLMDLRMPVMDGHKATQEILKIDKSAKIVAQTAFAMTSDRDECLANGFSDYIAKPIKKEKLLQIFNKWIK